MQLFYQTPSPNLNHSKSYFTDLGFTILPYGESIIAYDSQFKLLIDPKPTTRPGLCLIKENWEAERIALEKLTKVLSKEDSIYFADPSGTWVELKNGSPVDIPKTDSKCLLGNFAGLSLELIDIELATKIWTALGFEHKMGSIEKGWMSFGDQFENNISMMVPFACPHLFLNPSLTFFNGADNPKIIKTIRERSIPILEEITAFNKEGIVDNIILSEPGGYGFFIFND